MDTILLADDDEDLRSIVRITLERSGRRILEASSGREALDLVHQHAPDVALLDWSMLEPSGIEVAERLARDPATARIRVIMLTARDRPTDLARGQALRVFRYLVKLFSPLDLDAAIESALTEPGPES